ncbi:uncharacterized protein UV8b_03912 [Ustilaginoidea virens]|uniref:Uncharacterized protein n=1 Tax=Ustilaginoidea virens TaxID=1159556 RepID=A0A8E5MHH3_USTVR|nr:uncharacterized protein UV8b_03912 [Ustilaginoidea virens]QUC19671.1 hypothetical protein UV8b_03912 [Ustilaginoidea virens]
MGLMDRWIDAFTDTGHRHGMHDMHDTHDMHGTHGTQDLILLSRHASNPPSKLPVRTTDNWQDKDARGATRPSGAPRELQLVSLPRSRVGHDEQTHLPSTRNYDRLCCCRGA